MFINSALQWQLQGRENVKVLFFVVLLIQCGCDLFEINSNRDVKTLYCTIYDYECVFLIVISLSFTTVISIHQLNCIT